MSQPLIDWREGARRRTLALIEGLDSGQPMGPKLPIVNPLRWEIGHAAYFYEYWILRQHLGEPPVLPSVDRLYHSITIAHDDRWDPPRPSLEDTLAYMHAVHDRVRRHVEQDGPDPQRDYLLEYASYHEDMHGEVCTYTHQALEYPTPAIGALPAGVSAFGCRQMIGNAWERTEDSFGPYPGFTPGMYADHSQPLFGNTKVLRGGAWTTRGRMIRNTWRTYYGPGRNDVFAGFRTCAP